MFRLSPHNQTVVEKSSRSLAMSETVGIILKDPIHLPSVTLVLVTTIGICICARAVRSRCYEIGELACDSPKYASHDGIQCVNPDIDIENALIRGDFGKLREYEEYVDILMLEARLLVLYPPILSAFPLPLAYPYFWYVFVNPPPTADLAPPFTVLMILSFGYLFQRAVFDHALDLYFETVANCSENFDFHEDVMSREEELETSAGLHYVYLWLLFAVAPSNIRSNSTSGCVKSVSERHPLLSRQSSGAGRRGRRSPFPTVLPS
jgi:hypothetical protein